MGRVRKGKSTRRAADDLAAASDGTTDGQAAAESGGDTAATVAADVPAYKGLTNIRVGAGSVEADLAYEYRAPDRSQVHIAAAPADTSGDSDRDGLSDAAEARYGTNPHHYDSDYDGLTDGVEVQIGTDPLNKEGDADKDGVSDAREVSLGTDPHDADTDDDGIGDAEEIERYPFLAIMPTPKSTDADWDGDGISNDIEARYGQNMSVPENQVPELQTQLDRDYELRLQLQQDPVQQAMIATDLQRELTPAQEAALLDAVFERGIASDSARLRYSLDSQLNVIDGTPVSPELAAAAAAEQAAILQKAADSLATGSLMEALGGARSGELFGDSTLIAAADARLTEITRLANQVEAFGDPAAMLQLQAALPGIDLTPTLISGIAGGAYLSTGGSTGDTGGPTATGGTTSSGTASGGDASGSTPVNQADAALDRMGDGIEFASPTSPSSPSAPAADTTGDGGAAAPVLPSPSEPSGTQEFTPDNTATNAADNLADWADGVAGQIGATGSGGDGSAAGSNTGTTEGAQLQGSMGTVEMGEFDEAGSAGLSSKGTADDGRGYTDYNWGDQGTQRVYDDGNYQWYNADGSARGEEVDTKSSDASDETNPYAGTTDDDGEVVEDTEEGEDDADDSIDDGNSDPAAAWVNPDADPIVLGTTPLTMSPVVAQIVTTGADPTTTTPSGPYVDDSAGPVVVSGEAVHVGLNVPINPLVIDGDPDGVDLMITDGAPVGFDPEGPDVIDPYDPLVGGGGEDINPGDFTPRPSAAMTAMFDSGPEPGFDQGFDPDPMG